MLFVGGRVCNASISKDTDNTYYWSKVFNKARSFLLAETKRKLSFLYGGADEEGFKSEFANYGLVILF